MTESILAVVAAVWGIAMGLSPALQIRQMPRPAPRGHLRRYFMVLNIGFLLWLSYGLAIGNLAVAIPNVVAFTVGVVTSSSPAACVRRGAGSGSTALAAVDVAGGTVAAWSSEVGHAADLRLCRPETGRRRGSGPRPQPARCRPSSGWRAVGGHRLPVLVDRADGDDEVDALGVDVERRHLAAADDAGQQLLGGPQGQDGPGGGHARRQVGLQLDDGADLLRAASSSTCSAS